MSIPEQLQGHPVSVVVTGADELPILFANAFFLQASGDGTFILTVAQAAPPLFAGTPEEQQQQLLQLESVSGRPLVRIAVSAARLKEFADVVQGTLTAAEGMLDKGGNDGTQQDISSARAEVGAK